MVGKWHQGAANKGIGFMGKLSDALNLLSLGVHLHSFGFCTCGVARYRSITPFAASTSIPADRAARRAPTLTGVEALALRFLKWFATILRPASIPAIAIPTVTLTCKRGRT